MIRTKSDDKIMDAKSEEDYDFRNAEMAKNCVVKFTPPSETKNRSREQGFMSPRWLSKSVPRRNRSIVRYKINRSLNFDIGHRTNNYFTSSKTNVNNSPRNDSHLSRSAKILKALNIDYNPMKSSSYKKINKTLNFDLTPSPKRFSNANKSQCHISNLRLTSPGVNKTLNFDSSEDSPVASSLHDTSVESIDENQNQTPSQRTSKVKKSLSYISLSSNGSNTSLDFNLLSPSLRPELREKIDEIVHTSSISPQSVKNSPGHDNIHIDSMIVSTPRNSFNDFSDDDEERPETPKNAIRLIPESMSAIKKSHRKERISGRFAYRIQEHAAQPMKMETAEDEEIRPSTPLTRASPQTLNYNLRSIKKSHKKDKSRQKSGGYRSEDEMSETGSLFDYSALEEEKTDDKNSKCISDKQIHNSIHSAIITEKNVNEAITQTPLVIVPEVDNTTSPTAGPTTPENRIDYLRRVMTDSIKKSHKKLKEANKKSFLKARILERQINDMETNEFSLSNGNKEIQNESSIDDKCVGSPSKSAIVTSNDANRSSTPENMNSSRLLLAQFSSVKKSHKKDKHRKMGFAQRHIAMLQQDKSDSSPVNSEDEAPTEAPLLTTNIPLISITEASTTKSSFGSSFSSITSSDRTEFRSLGTSPLETSDDSDVKSMVSSPNKRKSPENDENENAEASSSFSNESRMEYESAEDEFKIFTPIKKRKPLVILSTPRVFNNNNSPETQAENSLSNGRCDTPKIGLDILISERKSDLVVSGNDNNKCSKQVTVNNIENENGRLTPENNDRLDRISALSSIKKSHKKDKWSNARRRSIRTLKETFENDGTKIDSINNWRQSRMHDLSSDSGEKTESFEDEINPKPSTSRYSDPITESSSPLKTPPNGLEAKTYLRLIQTTSIKRSHKKMRLKKKIESIILDGNLSDDGSIFDETEKSFNENTVEHQATEIDDNHEDFMPLDDNNANKITKKKVHYSEQPHSFDGNRSRDGSIFDSDGEMNSKL